MRRRLEASDVLDAVKALHAQGPAGASSSEIHARAGGSYATVGRLLSKLVEDKILARSGKARATRYFVAPATPVVEFIHERVVATDRYKSYASPGWSPQARAVLDRLRLALGTRQPVTYQRRFVDDYVPNVSSLLPHDLAAALAQEGTMPGRQPAGTYARKVLEPLLIDLSWSSSRLEGNTYSLLATEELFRSGAPPRDRDGVMLLNHKRAIEFLVGAVPAYGLTEGVIRNLHALLMQDLMTDSTGLGAIRTQVINISGTSYIPTQIPQLLEEMLGIILSKARQIGNPVEAAFFLWVNLAYLQAFEDGNKRTSRLAANIPLMLYNCAPFAFFDVYPEDYAKAMLGIYELLDVTVAVEYFAWTYRRSIQRYAVILEAMGSPDAFRVQHRENLSAAVQRIVRESLLLRQVIADLGLPAAELDTFGAMLEAELKALTPYNSARYRVSPGEVQAWIDRGRPL